MPVIRPSGYQISVISEGDVEEGAAGWGIRVEAMAQNRNPLETPDVHNPLDDPDADPFEIAARAAAEIAEKTGVAHHDIAGEVRVGDAGVPVNLEPHEAL